MSKGVKNAKKILRTSLKLIHIYFIIHIYIYKCIIDTEEKHNYNILITDVYENLFLLNIDKNSMIFEIIGIYVEQIKDYQILSKLYLFIFLYQTSNNKHELTKYFNFVFNKMIKGIKNLSVSIKYLFIIIHFYKYVKQYILIQEIWKITYDLSERILTISRSINKEETEKQLIFDFLEKESLDGDYVDEDLYKEFIKEAAKNQSKNDVYLPNRFKMLKRKVIIFHRNSFI